MEAPPQPPQQEWEALFTPVIEPLNVEHFGFDNAEEVELTGCSLEELSSAKDMSWESFRGFLSSPNENGQHRIVSLAPGVFLSIREHPSGKAYLRSSGGKHAYLVSQTKTDQGIWMMTADGYERAATSSCDFLLGLLARSDQPDTSVFAANHVSPCPVSGDAIESFLTKSNDDLGELHFYSCTMKEGHFQGFTNAPAREGVNIVLNKCVIDASVSSSFLGCAQKGHGPTFLWNCVIYPIVLGQALTSSSRLTRLAIGKLELNDHACLTIVRAVAENKSLLEFDLKATYISDQNWSVLCKVFHAHPTLTRLRLDLNRQPDGFFDTNMWYKHIDHRMEDRIMRRMNDVLSMLHVNSVLEDVVLLDDDSGVLPILQNLLDKMETRLAMNKSAFEAQCHSIGPLVPDLRPKLLGRALHMARLNPKLLWKFLSDHFDVVVETADDRIFSNLDAAAQQQRRQVDLGDAQNKRSKREAS